MFKIKIVHLCLQAPYNDYWGYQDNLLPKYHKRMGHDVTVITTNTRHENGKVITVPINDYFLSDEQRIIRLDYKRYNPNFICLRYKYFHIYDLLCDINPDFIMIHGLSNISALQAIKYKNKKNKECKIISDNHLDYVIGEIKNTFSNRIFRISYKLLNKYTQKNYEKVYGVTPWRTDYAEKVFGISPKKTDTLFMGADDEKINFDQFNEIRIRIRKKYNILDSDFVFVTGGKLEPNKKIIETMKSFGYLKNNNAKLLIFGSVHKDIESEFFELVKNDKRIMYIGFIKSEEMYDYFFASDCAVFAGQHSVIWEQAVAAGIPAIFRKYVDGYVDIGGNCILLDIVSEDTIQQALEKVINDQNFYQSMKKVANSDAKKQFFYSEIAKKSLE